MPAEPAYSWSHDDARPADRSGALKTGMGKGARFVRVALAALLTWPIVSCGAPAACVDGCRDSCGPRYRSGCVDEYRAGYATGYADGLQDRLTFAVVSDARAKGYADGREDGQADRAARERR
jgi:hypothetical protein